MAPTDRLLTEAANRFGTPAYLYDIGQLETRLAALRSALGRWFTISFAVKSNPNPALLRWMERNVDSLDISSGGEFDLALEGGWPAHRLAFTGPGKRREEIETVVRKGLGELVVESLREARLADEIAGSIGRSQPILVRLAPDRVPKGFGDQMAGRPSPFGIDVEDAPASLAEIARLQNLSLVGLHIYSGTQCLRPAAICENWRIFIGVFRDVCSSLNVSPVKLVFGSGLGIPYHHGDVPLNLSEIASEIGPDLDAFRAEPRFSSTQLVLELGRYLVGEAGYFITRVISVKESRGIRIAICDGGLNCNLAASGNFGMVLRRNYVMHRVGGDCDGTRPEQKIDISGPLCTSIDKIGSAVVLPMVEQGDLIALHACGAYGPTASPINFINHPRPREILAIDNQLVDVTRL